MGFDKIHGLGFGGDSAGSLGLLKLLEQLADELPLGQAPGFNQIVSGQERQFRW